MLHSFIPNGLAVKPVRSFKLSKSLIYLTFYLLISGFGLSSQAQICKPVASVYFETGKHAILVEEQSKLDKVIAGMNEQGDYVMEIYGYTDDEGTNAFNQKLSERRAQAIETAIRKSYTGKITFIRLIGKGEENPHFDNADPDKKPLNRRADLMLFPVKNGKLSLSGSKGSEILTPVDFFGECSICESAVEIREFLTVNQVNSEGIPLIATDESTLITGGMVSLSDTCAKVYDKPCKTVVVRIPTKNPDANMTAWESRGSGSSLRWESVPYPVSISKDGFYEITIPCFVAETMYNIDMKEFSDRQIKSDFNFKDVEIKDGSGKVVQHKLAENDSSLITVTLKYYDSMGTANHTANADGIKFTFDGKIEPYKDEQNQQYHLTRDDYSATILYSDTVVVLKAPGNYGWKPSFYIPVIDSTTDIAHYKNRKRKYTYMLPKADSKVRLEKGSKSKDFNYSQLKTRYKKKKKMWKVKVRRKTLKSLN